MTDWPGLIAGVDELTNQLEAMVERTKPSGDRYQRQNRALRSLTPLARRTDPEDEGAVEMVARAIREEETAGRVRAPLTREDMLACYGDSARAVLTAIRGEP